MTDEDLAEMLAVRFLNDGDPTRWAHEPEHEQASWLGDARAAVEDIKASTWLAEHDEGQRIKGVQGLLDFRPLPRDVRRYIESYLEAGAAEAGLERTDVGKGEHDA